MPQRDQMKFVCRNCFLFYIMLHLITARYCSAVHRQTLSNGCSFVHVTSLLRDADSSHCFLHLVTVPQRNYRRSGSLYLNRILFDSSEIDNTTTIDGDPSESVLASVILPKDDYRTIHVAKILRLRNGDTIRAGSVRCSSSPESNKFNGLTTDFATITWLPEGKIKKAEPTKTGDPPGSLMISIPHPPKTLLWKDIDCATIENGNYQFSDKPPVSLLLALPRPLQLGRILPMVSQMGVDQIILANAEKVPKDYFGSHIFRKPDVLRGLLIEGLAQSGDVRLPNVTITRRLKDFMEEHLDEMFPPGDVVRLIAHPDRKLDCVAKEEDKISRMSEIFFPMDELGQPRKLLIAVGPEGGWCEPDELSMFCNKGFQKVTMGTRILRSDVAVVSLLALANELCTERTAKGKSQHRRWNS